MNILSFGEVLWDIYPDCRYIGGAPLNFAAHLARHGEKVCMLSAVGDDSLGADTRKAITDLGLSDEFVSVADGKKTGQCLVTLDENSVPSYNLLADVAYDYINADIVNRDFDVLYFGTLALRSEHNFNTLEGLLDKRNFGDVFVDVNIRPPYYTERSVKFAVNSATIIKISEEELDTVSELIGISVESYKMFAKELAGRYSKLKCVIITLGSEGAYAFDAQTRNEYNCDSQKVQAVSTVGAGDSFSAAFLYKYLLGAGIQHSLDYASKIAGFVVSNYGAVPEYNAEDFKE